MHEKIRETYIYKHKDIEVCVVVDYVANEVSLVEKHDPSTGKKWLFTKRGYEYMEGWLTILEAMQEAVKDAKKKLREYQKAKEDYCSEILDKATELVIKGRKKAKK